MVPNPYASSAENPVADRQATEMTTEVPLMMLAKSVFLAWEKLRLIYIVLLGLWTLILAMPGVIYAGSQLFTFRGIVMVAEGAFVANICYFAGPVIETYVRWLGYEGKWVRWFLFLGGTVLTVILSTVSLASGSIPNQN